jgi:hypothetical protein
MQEWIALVRSVKRPKNIPANPSSTYKNSWISWGDFLGIERSRRPFKEVRAFARKLRITSAKAWAAFAKSGKRPQDIPSALERVYADDWRGWPDFLGTVGRPRPRRNWVPF